MPHHFSLIDVFASGPMSGNPLAVMDGAGLSDEEMMAACRWLNFSETTFLLPSSDPEADYRVRIFCPERELPFAGHPTLGTCHAWLERGGQPRGVEVVQECGAGLVRIRRDADRLAFAAPPLVRSGPVAEADLEAALKVLRIAPEDVVEACWADNGPGWLAVRLASAEAVLAVAPDASPEGRFDLGVVGPHAPGGEVAWEVRAFFSDHNGTLREDPVTGSLNASLAQWLLGEGLATASYVAAQGAQLGRAGRIYITQDEAGQVWVGGRSRTVVEGMAL